MPRTPESIAKLKENRRSEILKHSLHLFALNGYDATSISDIALALGTSHSLIYHYFKNKKEIFITLLDESISLGYMPLFPNLSSEQLEDPELTLRVLITKIFEELRTNNSDFAYYFYLYLNIRFQKTAPHPRFHVYQSDQRPFGILRSIVEAGQTKGVFALGDSRHYAILFFSIMRGLTYARLHDKNKFILPDVAVMMNLFIRKELANV